MYLLKNLVLIACVFSLAACATKPVPNGKLHPDHEQYVTLPAEISMIEIILDEPLRVKVPVTNVSVGGHWALALASAAASAAATGVSHAKRADEKKAILGSVNDKSIYGIPGQTYSKTIKSTQWVDIKENSIISGVSKSDKKELKKAGEEMRARMEGKGFSVYASEYVIGEQFESLTQNFRFQISNVKNGEAEKTLYNLILSDVYYPENSMDKGFENHKLWIANDNAEIKKAIRQTTKNINERLKEALTDPYYDPKTEQENTHAKESGR